MNKTKTTNAESSSVKTQKAQRKAIEKAINEGINEYKKNHQQKVREQDKKLKKAIAEAEKAKQEFLDKVLPETSELIPLRQSKLPWYLLLASWVAFFSYLVFIHLT